VPDVAGPPGGPGEVPPDKALVCVGDRGEYEAPGYLITEAEFAVWTDSADDGAKTLLLMDRDTADEPCRAAKDREYWRVSLERDAHKALKHCR
jgi:hypothetical protein